VEAIHIETLGAQFRDDHIIGRARHFRGTMTMLRIAQGALARPLRNNRPTPIHHPLYGQELEVIQANKVMLTIPPG